MPDAGSRSGSSWSPTCVWILTAQSTSYVVGVISWIFAERAGYRGFGKFMLRFARENRDKVTLLNEKPAREQVEPFLTGETFQCFFNVMYELEFALKLFLGPGLQRAGARRRDRPQPAVRLCRRLRHAVADAVGAAEADRARLSRKPAHEQPHHRAGLYRLGQCVFRQRYNLRLWLFGFKTKLREGLVAQIRAIVAREGMSAMSGIVSLAIVFATITVVAMRNVGDTVLLVGLATTLPRQIEMTYELHLLASGWNDFIAIWTRFGGVAANMSPQPDADFDKRIKYDRLVLREGDHANVVSSLGDALRVALAQPTGRINVRGGNGTGKSSLLASLKTELKKRAYYWPTTDRLAFQFAGGVVPVDVEGDDEDERLWSRKRWTRSSAFPPASGSSNRLQEIVNATDARSLSARRMGRQSRRRQQGQSRRSGRRACRAGPRRRNLASRPRSMSVTMRLRLDAAFPEAAYGRIADDPLKTQQNRGE